MERLESEGHLVYWPPRDNPYQTSDKHGDAIVRENAAQLLAADVVYLWWDPESRFSRFDLGVAYALRKPLVILNRGDVVHRAHQTKGKCEERFLLRWPWGDDC